jgi:hypothetical protein
MDATHHDDVRTAAAAGERANRTAARRVAEQQRSRPITAKADMHVIVVVCRQHLHDRRRTLQPGSRADEHLFRAGGYKAVDEVLRQPAVYLPRPQWWTLATSTSRPL